MLTMVKETESKGGSCLRAAQNVNITFLFKLNWVITFPRHWKVKFKSQGRQRKQANLTNQRQGSSERRATIG